MNIIGLVVVLIVSAFLLWLANTVIPMQPQIKTILNGFVVAALALLVVLWILQAFGLLQAIGNVRVH